MNDNNNQVHSQENWINHPHGKILSRTWYPSASTTELADQVPIVLMHDSLGSVELWREFPQRLCLISSRPVVAYDRLGFGKSAPRDQIPSLGFIAEEAQYYFPVVLEQLGIESFIVLGHSVGGGMAVNCAARFNGRCQGLVTLSAQTFPETQTLAGIRDAREYFQHPRTFARLEKYHGDKARWVLDAWTERWLSPEFASWSLNSVLPKVTCPVLALHGQNDPYGSSIHPETIAQLATGKSTMKLVADSEHIPHQEQQPVVLELIRDFLD